MRRCCLLLVCLLLLTGCGRADTQDVSSFAPAEGDRLVIFTSHKETIYEPILKEFEQRTGIWVELETGGTVTLLERIAAGESGADLMFGGGADSLSAYSACFAPYVSEYAGDVAPEYDLGGGIWTPFSALPVVLIYNTKLVRQNPPERWADLLDAGWARAHRLCRPDRFRLELHRARHPSAGRRRQHRQHPRRVLPQS